MTDSDTPSSARRTTAQQSSPTLFSAVGRSYFPIAFVARMPFAMIVVGVLTLVVAARGSLSLGGINSAMVGLGTALFGSFIGAAADRWGQRYVLLIAGILNCLALTFMAWVVFSPLPDIVVFIAAFAIGATSPQVAPMSRSRIVDIVSAFALHPTGRARSTGTSSSLGERAPAKDMFTAGVFVIILGVFGVGMVFGSTLTALTALTNDIGRPEEAGLIYGVMGIGSAVLAISVALFPSAFALWARLLCFAPVLVTGSVVLASTESMPIIVMALLLMGTGIGPSLVTLFSLAAERAPLGRSATVMSMAGSAIIVGQSVSSAINGILAEDQGTAVAMAVPVAASAIVLCAGVLNLFVGKRRDQNAVKPSQQRVTDGEEEI